MWRSNTIQFAWFVQSADKLAADKIYEKLVGAEPISVQRNKLPSPANPFFGVASGDVDEVAVQVQLQPGRVDLLIQPNEELQQASVDEIATFETRPYISRFLDRIAAGDLIEQPVNRLALVVNLAKPAASLSAGIDVAMDVSGFHPPVRPDSEFMVQLNSRIQLDGTLINRLVRFGVQSVQNLVFNVEVGQGAPVAAPTTAVRYATTTMLDFNTVPVGSWIDEAQQRTIFKLLGSEVLRVAEDGRLEALR
ncbi:hypothetical protein NIM87_05875 [Devosia sp. XJ19-1]|uniref:Uncharacterized protein n=1 Tax=Devosia ureilytica TaxID=2952754 RepID=A0A9Q4FRV2_9HYPH|nr:hypothetical protein [Devosia ureilytica]MCP8883020.1 hypothetical protein [Devosia ureilytica]MCP8886612.1 hypothetical protein [Devosia ureilytica]